MNSILRITDPIPSDTSIDRYEDIEYEPVTGTNLNNHGGDIRLYIETHKDKDKMELYKIIERKEKIPVGYRMIQCDKASIPQATSFSWRLSVKSSTEVPRFILVGFQTNKSRDQTQNPSIFNNVKVSNIYATLNSMRYPTADYNISFLASKFSRAYGDAAEFRS